MNKHISRRDFLKLAGGAAVTVAGASYLPQFLRKTLQPEAVVSAQTMLRQPDLFFAGTDGWFWLPDSPNLLPYFPDNLGEPTLIPDVNFNGYIFGFRNVTDMTDSQRQQQKYKAQHNAPFFWVDEVTDTVEAPDPNQGLHLQITNLGLQLRPDLTDAHTLHWHGFRNVIPFFDGEPSGSISVPVGERFTYIYKPRDPGTYMFHCHVEDVEHVTMGMTGLVFVNPKQNGNSALYPSGKYAYNDGDGSTGYDRQFSMFLSEFWAKGHWGDAHIQESDWSEFRADFSMLNGRVYPYTLLPNSPVNLDKSTGSNAHALTIQTDANGDLETNSSEDAELDTTYKQLQYSPHSALITCVEGERVLLRFANLGFREAAMTLAGIDLTVVGRDATLMRGRDGHDTSYITNTLLFGAGESFDAIFTAPAYDQAADEAQNGGAAVGYNTYMLYNRRYTQDAPLVGHDELGGQRTEVRVYEDLGVDTKIVPQEYINQHPDDQHYVGGVLQP